MNQKRQFSITIVLVIIMGIFVSCVTVQDKTLSLQEREATEIIGSVSTKFNAWQPLHIPLNNNISQRAYSRLMEEARKNYQGDIDIVNITASGDFNPLSILTMLLYFSSNVQTVTASGDVVLYSESSFSGVTQRMTDAVTNASLEMSDRIPDGSIIAVLSVFSNNRNTSEHIIGEIEYNLVNSGRFRIVDRRQLDQIRNEQNFHMSGDVSDDSAISIGNMLGASIVITGEISGVGSNQRLTLKALDVRTAQILTMVREEI